MQNGRAASRCFLEKDFLKLETFAKRSLNVKFPVLIFEYFFLQGILKNRKRVASHDPGFASVAQPGRALERGQSLGEAEDRAVVCSSHTAGTPTHV